MLGTFSLWRALRCCPHRNHFPPTLSNFPERRTVVGIYELLQHYVRIRYCVGLLSLCFVPCGLRNERGYGTKKSTKRLKHPHWFLLLSLSVVVDVAVDFAIDVDVAVAGAIGECTRHFDNPK